MGWPPSVTDAQTIGDIEALLDELNKQHERREEAEYGIH